MNEKYTFGTAWAVAVFLCAGLFPCQAEEKSPATVRHAAMGTEYEITLYPPKPDMKQEEVLYITDTAFDSIDYLEQRISTWRKDSDVSRANLHAAEGPVPIKSDLWEVLLLAKRYYQETDGAFDVTVGPLLDVWGFYKGTGHRPTPEEMKAALDKVGFNKLEIDENAQTLRFTRDGMRLDFGGIGKGLALDRAAQVLKDQGVKQAILNSGTSTVVAIGAPPEAPGWTVRIRSPYNDTKAYVDEVQIIDESLSTSSSSERYVELEGKKYSHIFDPRTGMPVEREVLSATVIAPTGTQSDALSTAFFVMGLDRTRAFCKAHPDVRAILVIAEDGQLKPVRINFPG